MKEEKELTREETAMRLLGEAHALIGFIAVSERDTIIKEESLLWLKSYADFSENFFEEITRKLEVVTDGTK